MPTRQIRIAITSLVVFSAIFLAGLVLTGRQSGAQPITEIPAAVLTPAAIRQAPFQELRLNLGGEPATVDPQRASWDNQAVIVIQVFEGLFGYNPDLTIRPLVAREIPSMANAGLSPDLRTYHFRLRRDARWADGRPVSARDFEYSLKRLLYPGLEATNAPLFYSIAGAEAYATARLTDPRLNELEAAVGVRALDDYTLEIRLNEPWAALPGLLAFWPALPVRQDLIERYGTNWTQPGYYTGNGPFRLVRWDYQNRIVLEPNRQYSGPAPTLQQITFYMNPDQDDELAAFRRGDQDIVALPLDIGVDKLSNPLYQPYLLRYGDLASYGLRLNTARSPFDRLGARRALSLGIDREALVKQVFGGVGRPAYGWAPPGIPGHDSSLAGRWRWDPATAQKELASAGVPSFPATPPLVLPHATTGTGLRLSEFVRDQIQPNLHLGVQMYPNTVRGMQESYSRGQYNLMPFAWVANYPDADPRSWARGLFTAEAAQSEESLMPAASGLMRQARVEQDSARRTDLWRQAQIVAAEDASLVFLYHRENLALVRPTIKGLQPTVMDGGFPGRYFFSQIRIEE